MSSIWLGLCPGARSTRVLAMRGPSEPILKAHLSLRPSSPRAVTALFEAIALWEGAPVRAALAVDESSTSACQTTLYRDLFGGVRRHAALPVGVGLVRGPPSSTRWADGDG
jgi:hypothetical protein